MQHTSGQETHLALKGCLERGGKFGHVHCPPVVMRVGLFSGYVPQVMSLRLCPSALCMHPPCDMCTNEVIVLQVL